MILPILLGFSNTSTLTIEISWAHEDKSGKLTPLAAVTLSTENIKEKVKQVDLICIFDVSGSMGWNNFDLVKNSLEYIVNKKQFH